jgi:nitronate monooxygenase
MAIQNRLTRILGIERPILLAPMDIIAGGKLAAAVSHAGGLGLLGGGYGSGEWIEREWANAGNARIGCGFIAWALAERPDALDRALAHHPAAVMLSFGDPRPFASTVKAAGARLICGAQTLVQARDVAEAGADVIVAQGSEGGGHGMSESLMTLVPQIADACPSIPVVAAGGIADGHGVAAAMMLGAEGALMGTRFYASQESLGHPEAKRRIVAAKGGERRLVRASSTFPAGSCGPRAIPAGCCATLILIAGSAVRTSLRRTPRTSGAAMLRLASVAISISPRSSLARLSPRP